MLAGYPSPKICLGQPLHTVPLPVTSHCYSTRLRLPNHVLAGHRDRHALRCRAQRSGGEPGDPQETPFEFRNKDIKGFLEYLAKDVDEDLQRNNQLQDDLKKIDGASDGDGIAGWLNTQLLQFLQNREAESQKYRAQVKSALGTSQRLPDNTSFDDTMEKLLQKDDTRTFVMKLLGGPSAIAVAGTQVLGAFLFAWLAGFFGAQPYLLWHEPWDDQWQTFAVWTAPYLAILGLAAVARSADAEQVVRPLPNIDERSTGPLAQQYLGPFSKLLYAFGWATAAGLVFRGVWLNSIRGTMFTPQPSPLLDPDMAEAMLRNSFGSLIPSIPAPAFLLLFGAAATTALLEVVYRIPNALDAKVDDEEDGVEDLVGRMAAIVRDGNSGAANRPPETKAYAAQQMETDSIVDASDGLRLGLKTRVVARNEADPNDVTTAVVTTTVDLGSVALEFVLAAYLAVETLTTQSLWTSIGTQALGILTMLYIAKPATWDMLGNDTQKNSKW